MHERLAKKLAHPAVDLARAEVAVIEKNLQLHAGFLIVIRQRHRDLLGAGDCRGRRRRFLDGLRRDGREREQNEEDSGMHRRCYPL